MFAHVDEYMERWKAWTDVMAIAEPLAYQRLNPRIVAAVKDDISSICITNVYFRSRSSNRYLFSSLSQVPSPPTTFRSSMLIFMYIL